MATLDPILRGIREQQAPESHIARINDLLALAEAENDLQALFLVGSYAKGTADRVSDLDLVAIAAPGRSDAVLRRAHEVLRRAEILHEFHGAHGAGGKFWKLVYLDFSSVEFHVFEPDTKFKLKRPHISLWDPANVLSSHAVEGEPIRHEDFAAYQYGDEGLIWELVDCIKWLSRGRNALAKEHIKKLAAEINRRESRR